MLYLELFNREYIEKTPVTGVVLPTDINYLRRLYAFNKTAIEQYYLDRKFTVKNTHIVSRFLEHIPPHLNYEDFRYLEYIDDKVKYLAKHFKFTSDMERGIVHPPHFFGNGGEEVILIDPYPVNVSSVKANWKLEPAIQILKHPKNDTKMLLPLGKNDNSRGGLSVILINTQVLSIKYREFMREQHRASLSDGSFMNKNHFVPKYLLNTTVGSTTDHVFLNKIMDKFYGREEVTPKYKHRFKIFEPTRQIERYIDQTLDVITDKKLDFANILHNIQLPFSLDASQLLQLPSMYGTRQSRWAMLVSRLEHMVFLYDVAKDKGRNKHYINDFKRLVSRLERDSAMFNMFTYDQGVEIREQMYKIKNM